MGEPFAGRLSSRDARIIERTLNSLPVGSVRFEDAVTALRAAVEAVIPAGHVYLLGALESMPVIGSRVSGLGLTPANTGVMVVRLLPNGTFEVLGPLHT